MFICLVRSVKASTSTGDVVEGRCINNFVKNEVKYSFVRTKCVDTVIIEKSYYMRLD